MKLALHLASMYFARAGHPAPGHEAGAADHARGAVLADVARLVAQAGAKEILVAVPAQGRPFRSALAQGWRREQDEGGKTERAAVLWEGLERTAEALASAGARIMAPAPYPSPHLLSIGGDELVDVSGMVASSRDVVATLARQHREAADGSELRIVTTRPSVAALLSPEHSISVALLVDGAWQVLTKPAELAAWKGWHPRPAKADGPLPVDRVPRALLADYEALTMIHRVGPETAIKLLRPGGKWRGAISALSAAEETPEGKRSEVQRRLVEMGARGLRELLAVAGLRDDVPIEGAALAPKTLAEPVSHAGKGPHAAAQADDGAQGVAGTSRTVARPSPSPDETSASGEGAAEGDPPVGVLPTDPAAGCGPALPVEGLRNTHNVAESFDSSDKKKAFFSEEAAAPQTTAPSPLAERTAEKETRPMQQRPQQNTRPIDNSDKGRRIAAIEDIFRARWRELVAIFPENGEALATRAKSTACMISKSMGTSVTAESIAEAALACHHLGLEVGDQAYIYPFGNTAKLTVGPRGLIALAYRSGFVKSIVARAVFDGDEFDYNLGTNEITHRKTLDARRPRDERGNLLSAEKSISHAYVLIETTTDGRILEVLTWEDIAFYRGFSQATSGPWFNNYEGMCRKTAIKRGLEFVPRSPLLSAALAETKEGTYELTPEIMEAIRGKGATRQEEPQHEPARGDVPSQAEAS